jgi:ubiquinone/menaquinone biosynthesis C-methylase UbiE
VVDIGSSIKTMGIISRFCPVIFVDIRPPEIRVNNLYYIQADILRLPFKDNSLDFVTSLCVIEHIGLGRYGDKLDAFGSEKAVNELIRIVKPGGVILISVPVDTENKIYYNAHRPFTREYIIELFSNCKLIEEKYQYGFRLYDNYDPAKGFGTGLFMFQKRSY